MGEKKRIKAVLFDLDGTLLDIDMNSYIPYYLLVMAKELFPDIPPRNLLRKL